MDDSHNISQTKKVDGPCGRCVGRSNNNANANNASSNSNANNGSRLNLGNTSDEIVSPGVNRHTAHHHGLVDSKRRGTRASAKADESLESGNITNVPEGAMSDLPFDDGSFDEFAILPEQMYPVDNLISEIIDEKNLSDSFDYVISHLEHKQQREKYWPKKDRYIRSFRRRVADGSYRLRREAVREITVHDGPKDRVVQVTTVFDRFGCHSIMVVVEKYTYPTLIKNAAASVKGRGMHWLHHIVEEDIKVDPTNMQNYGQSDVFHYYDSIVQEMMKAIVREYIGDPIVLKYLDNFIELMPEGLSKGLRSSQGLANLYLSAVDKIMCQNVSYHTVEIDNKDEVMAQGRGRVYTDKGDEIHYHYYRYCDDIVFFASTKTECWKLYDLLKSELEKLGLKIKDNFAIRPISEGLDFLGFKTFGKWKIVKGQQHWEVYSRIRKRIKVKAARALHRAKSRKRRQQIIGSFKGMACHADCKHLYFKLTGQHMAKFSELGLKYTPADGKKRFSCQHMSLGSITNRPIELLDYEKDIKTRWGESRYVVLFHFVGDVTEYKFFTDSAEMKDLLDQMKDRGLLPGAVETTIVQKQGTGALRIYSFS